MRYVKRIMVLGLAALLAMPAAAQVSSSKSKKSRGKETPPTVARASSQDYGQKPLAATSDAEYVIGPEDILSISVWKEPEVSGAVPVRPDGKISLPLLNDVQAAGNTPMQLASIITERLKQFLTEPRVTVIVTAINSRRIYIMGEVGRAGAFPLIPNMTVLQALSSAGGFSQFANLKKIYVLRNENGKQVKLPFNYREVISGQATDQNIQLKPGDTIVVP